MSNGATIVIVEDDAQIRYFVRRALEDEGFQLFEAETVARGLTLAASRSANLIILDLGLPDCDGIEFIQVMRQFNDTPIIVLSARCGETEKINVLNAGADDYLAKPFSIGELIARIGALLRRRTSAPAGEASTFSFGDVNIDFLSHSVSRAGKPLHLTHTEYRLLCYMISNRGKVLTHRQLLQNVWGASFVQRSHYTRIFVGRLRQKLEDDPAQPRFILTETGVGYRFSDPSGAN